MLSLVTTGAAAQWRLDADTDSCVELTRFSFEVAGLGLPAHGAAGVGNLVAKKGRRSRCSAGRSGSRPPMARAANMSRTGAGRCLFRGSGDACAASLGRDPDKREEIWQDLRREIRAYDHMGHGPVDIALWDLQAQAARHLGERLLGGFRKRLPTYASTYHGQDEPGGLDSPQAFADYAAACEAQGFAGFKIHGWHTAMPKPRDRQRCWPSARRSATTSR